MSQGRELDVAAILAGIDDDTPEDHRAGLVAIVGRPNTGKSTLLNRVVGEKVAIVTRVPGTTRSTVRAVLTEPHRQLVFLDTPGLTKPSTLLAQRLNDRVRETWAGVDVVVLVTDVAAGIGPGDAWIAAELADLDTPVVAVANKVDRVQPRSALLPALTRLSELGAGEVFADVVPVSAATGENVDRLVDVVTGHLPRGRRLVSGEQVSDQTDAQLAAEIVREKLIRRLDEEVPHSIAVTVDDVVADPDRPDVLRIEAVIHVERDSQKGIVIGHRGEVLKAAATEARHELEAIFTSRVYLATHVRVARRWQRDPKQLGRLGY